MKNSMGKETLVELFLLETNQLIEQLEMIIIECEKKSNISFNDINSIFRIMHTIKGSSSMMVFNNIASLSHSIEDLFFYIREHNEKKYDFQNTYSLVLNFIDYIKEEIVKLANGKSPDGDCEDIMEKSKAILRDLQNIPDSENAQQVNETGAEVEIFDNEYEKNYYCVKIVFEPNSDIENVRSRLVLYSLRDIISEMLFTVPANIDLEESAKVIKKDGFFACFCSSLPKEKINEVISSNLSIKSFKLIEVDNPPKDITGLFDNEYVQNPIKKSNLTKQQGYINVPTDKLNVLMDLVGELVISEAMVTKNPDLEGLNSDNFNKAAQQLGKLINELRDAVLDIRMLPVSFVFQKMHRIIRDMGKELNKKVNLVVSGEDTQVDKSVIDVLSDPVMHLIRNAMDHGIETEEERKKANKPAEGQITLKAWQNSDYAFVEVSDDGRGMDAKEIYEKAVEKGLISKGFSELTDKEIFSFILAPGFSTKVNVTEFSGRGVGLDVVKKNIDSVGGSTSIKSELGKGTSITIRIPLTLMIVKIVNVSVGHVKFSIPIRSVLEIKNVNKDDVVSDQNGNEMIIIREVCYPIIRLHRFFNIKTGALSLDNGILLFVEGDNTAACLFADRIESEQQIVVKPLPNYIKKAKGILGCSIQNDGSLSLVLDMNEILSFKEE